MSTPFSISGVLTYPPDDGKPAVERDISGSGSYDVKHEAEYPLTGSGTQVVSFGPVTNGAKAVQVEVIGDASAPTTPVNVRLNGGSDNLQISPGGGFTYFNPTPGVGGLISLSIVYTAACKVIVRALG